MESLGNHSLLHKANTMIALVDCNNFYCSCERVLRPDLEGKPIVVLSNNDGCIISRSQEAKALDIDMGSPFFKIKSLLKKNKVNVFSSNYTLYGDMSARVVECIDQFSDKVEVYSVDEAFALFQFADHRLEERGRTMRNTILQWTGIPVKVGIAHSKTLAKIAAKKAKQQPSGVYAIFTNEHRKKMLANTPIHKVWGIGGGYKRFLEQYGVVSALDFSELPNQFIRSHMGVVGLRMAYELRGTACQPLKTQSKPKQMILTSRSFSHPVTTLIQMKEAIAAYVHECSSKLRNENLVARSISISIETYSHRTEEPQNNRRISYRLTTPTDSMIELNQIAQRMIESIYKDGYKYKKAGILLLELAPKEHAQTNLFQKVRSKENYQLMQTMDSLNLKHGNNTVKLLSEGIDQSWKMNQKYHSKKATTRWSELIEV